MTPFAVPSRFTSSRLHLHLSSSVLFKYLSQRSLLLRISVDLINPIIMRRHFLFKPIYLAGRAGPGLEVSGPKTSRPETCLRPAGRAGPEGNGPGLDFQGARLLQPGWYL